MSKITIGKKEYEVEEQQLNQCELLFYEDNPRVYSVLRENGASPTQKDIQDHMTQMDHVKQLRLSIEQNGGLIDPLIVVKRNRDYVVLEGNSRLAAYRLLAGKDPVKWQKVRVNILPEDISENDIFTLLGQYHLVGRKDWSAFEQAAYLYRQKQTSGLENDILAKNVGLSKGDVDTYISVYTFMLEHKVLKSDKWSYFIEYLKKRGIRKYRETSPSIDDVFVKQVKSGEIEKAEDVRTLEEIAKSNSKPAKKIMQDYIDEKESLYDGYDKLKSTGKTTHAYKQINKFPNIICDEDFNKNLLLEATTNGDIKFELKKILKQVEDILKKLS